MQQHPVPQNVVGWQFKLVGDMTLKQFGYLFGGLVLAFVFSKLPYPSIIIYPLAGIIAFFGFALAFVPIEERPMDIWVKNFFLSIMSPTQFLYQKTGGKIDYLDRDFTSSQIIPSEILEKAVNVDRYQDYLKTLPQKNQNPFDNMEKGFVKSLDFSQGELGLGLPVLKTEIEKAEKPADPPLQTAVSDFQANALFSLASISRPSNPFESVTVRPLHKIIKEELKGEILLEKLLQNKVFKKEEKLLPPEPKISNVVKNELAQTKIRKELSPESSQFATINLGSRTTSSQVADKLSFETNKGKNQPVVEFDSFKKIKALEKKKVTKFEPDEKQKENFINSEVQKLVKKQRNQEKNRKIIIPTPKIPTFDAVFLTENNQFGVLTPVVPGIIKGAVCDQNSNPLAGAIVEIKNEKLEVVRTLKTNLLGQFAIATPLVEQGKYFISAEKENFSFDIFCFFLDNEIVKPIILKAKQP